jgi:hypothetical protein
VVLKLIIPKNKTKQKQKHRNSNNKKFTLLGKSSGLILLVSNAGIVAWYSGLCGEGYCPFCQIIWGGDDWKRFFFYFFYFPWSYGPSVTSKSSEVISPGDWLVSSIWFFLSMGPVEIGA